ncbi:MULTISPECIES: hypothetical protein [Phyllobacteriaceae]|jgi:hypothetical protein|uniref:Uncharacterized protein n=1 Tax=Mesorhizobium hungaricum TaxID=1566387 RepID=A0A1C2DDE6_9HYPH|nr:MULTISPECIES: hypothetical protein [Mesorhizobium]MBN9235146.1 hypothetical protein [Mesorhizobium sp.]OCX12656.1 hypothetical protein QV13_23960 [Mesorhizobium hungaricum]
MNDVDARSVAVFGGYHGEFRKVHKADWEVVQRHGRPIIYTSAYEAEIAAWRALRAHLCGDIVGSGQKAGTALSEAESKFKKLFRGGGKTVTVEQR